MGKLNDLPLTPFSTYTDIENSHKEVEYTEILGFDCRFFSPESEHQSRKQALSLLFTPRNMSAQKASRIGEEIWKTRIDKERRACDPHIRHHCCTIMQRL